MSDQRSGSPFVTPTFQAVLNRQLAKIMDSLDANQPVAAFVTLKTLIGALNPKDRKPLLDNDVAHIENRVRRVLQVESVDLYQTRWRQSKAIRSILRANIFNLFVKVMGILHEGGYLEKQPVAPKKPSKERLSWRK